ncbi:hypothetical protein BDV95DRAFT_586623 [Massariosphaeria phaeospora]|uniref:Secreted protein n=1 Tax=Massariosphaeria phaeospora TaxID=100035 RepID=A0A7C8M200_9PLEO|nr:hypothetical protein BDV95DRAFT_586623 [Massariosphaeria phaeospora]
MYSLHFPWSFLIALAFCFSRHLTFPQLPNLFSSHSVPTQHSHLISYHRLSSRSLLFAAKIEVTYSLPFSANEFIY